MLINRPVFTIELKKDYTPENAIARIKEREYYKILNNYKGKKLIIGIA